MPMDEFFDCMTMLRRPFNQKVFGFVRYHSLLIIESLGLGFTRTCNFSTCHHWSLQKLVNNPSDQIVESLAHKRKRIDVGCQQISYIVVIQLSHGETLP